MYIRDQTLLFTSSHVTMRTHMQYAAQSSRAGHVNVARGEWVREELTSAKGSAASAQKESATPTVATVRCTVSGTLPTLARAIFVYYRWNTLTPKTKRTA